MIEAADIQRITRDWAAGAASNDNRPIDPDELVYPWMRETRRKLIRAVLWTLYCVAVAGGCVISFLIGWGKL